MKTYTIKKGKHSSGFHFGLVFNSNMEHTVIFTESCKYFLGGEDQEDWNKLFGFSIGFNHMTNSVRFAWRFNIYNNKIEIGYFIENNGVRSMGFLDFVQLYTPVKLSIIKSGNLLVMQVNNNPGFATNNIQNLIVGYKLYPYFGGNKTAPHDIKINFLKPI